MDRIFAFLVFREQFWDLSLFSPGPYREFSYISSLKREENYATKFHHLPPKTEWNLKIAYSSGPHNVCSKARINLGKHFVFWIKTNADFIPKKLLTVSVGFSQLNCIQNSPFQSQELYFWNFYSANTYLSAFSLTIIRQ